MKGRLKNDGRSLETSHKREIPAAKCWGGKGGTPWKSNTKAALPSISASDSQIRHQVVRPKHNAPFTGEVAITNSRIPKEREKI